MSGDEFDESSERPGTTDRGDDVDMEVFAGVAVSDLPRAVSWFDGLLGDVESFEPNDTERVWTLGGCGHVYAELLPEHAGHSMVTLFVSDFDAFIAGAAERGIEPGSRETYGNGVRKAIYRDPDGNEVGVAGPPIDEVQPGRSVPRMEERP